MLNNIGYLNTNNKIECFGCEACEQVCPVSAIKMIDDEEGFRYPVVDTKLCVNCKKCNSVCPYENEPSFFTDKKIAYGGHINDKKILGESTSGGAFSAIVEGFCDKNYVIFGATADGIRVYHTYITDKNDLGLLRKSKYLQSEIGSAYINVKKFLLEGKKVLFSGTPCQIAGLKNFLGKTNQDKLLLVEVVCEGVPTPYYIKSLEKYLYEKYGEKIKSIDYRCKQMKSSSKPKGKWDFEAMDIKLKNGKRFVKDRWINPFWSIWLKHLMNRPSCYECPFAKQDRVADITLGDLWGVHIYCPDLYNHNAGASLIVCNTEKGRNALEDAGPYLIGRELDFNTALKYQGPMRKHIDYNPERENFMQDVKSMDYKNLCDKYATKMDCKLFYQKYIWGNRQKVKLWNIKNRKHIKVN